MSLATKSTKITKRPMHDSGIAWIGSVPEGWKVKRLKYVFEDITDGSHFSPQGCDEGYPYITATDVRGVGIDFEHTVKIDQDAFAKLVASGCKICRDDVLIVKDGATTGRVGLMIDDTECVALSSVAMLRTRMHDAMYLMYSMMSNSMQEQIKLSMAGSAMPRITVSKLGEFVMPLPPLPEQKAIAAYLDRECGRIDGLRAKIEQQIEKLGEYKKSLITEAVTGKKKVEKRGGGGQWRISSYSQLRDSGVSWIGQVPAGWKVCRVKNIGTARNGLTYTPQDVCEPEDGLLVLRSSNVQQGKLCYDDNVYVSCSVPAEIMMRVGDILICSRNGSRELIGKNAIVEADINATYGAFMMVFRANDAIKSKYAYWLFNSDMFSFYLCAFSTATINQLTRNDFGEMKIPLPPLPEQREIAAYLDEKCGAIEAMVEKCRGELEKLAEYKKSLIFECVTGKRAVA